MTGLVIAIAQIGAAYLIFKWVLRQLSKGLDMQDTKAQKQRLQVEVKRAQDLAKTVLDKLDTTQPNPENTELNELLLIDAMNREARAKASLLAVLREHGCNQEEIDAVMDTIDAKQHRL